jgi:GMP synthase (glutamine-hydrolysing)
MRKLLVFQHVAYEPLGTLDAQFRAAGFRIRYVNFARTGLQRLDVRRYHGLVVLGGPMSVNDAARYPHLLAETEAITVAIDAGIPVLGICLGAQLIASALGAVVRPNAVKEIGWSTVRRTVAAQRDPLFRHFGSSEHIFQWHGDTFDLPHGATWLAETRECRHQAFRYGDDVYGLQFHLEVDRPLIDRWLATPAMREELRELRESTSEQRIRAETQRYIARAMRLSHEVFGAFIARFFGWRRRRALPSR